MQYWWVNQNRTYEHEVPGGFLWSPKKNKNGAKNQFYENMRQVQVGDLVLSFCDAQIKAVGVAQGSAQPANRPDFGRANNQWSDEGWLVKVEFKVAEKPVRPKDYIKELVHYLPDKYSPLQSNGNGKQGVYLTKIPKDFAEILLAKMGISALQEPGDDRNELANQRAQEGIQGRTDIGEPVKQQLIQARRGQGKFKENVCLNETCCRLTGVTDLSYLIASHIKPWRDCTDEEKLHGCNGLLLSPHVDRLFDRGLISFADDGTVLKSKSLPSEVWHAWGLDHITQERPFNPAQCAFLAIHRKSYFKG